jgi:rhodanese-related sulfurtransferase
MEAMKLPHPNRMAEAVPGNLRSGRPVDPVAAQPWAPLLISYAGLPELPPAWVAQHRSELTVLDVRSAEEFHGPDGHIAGSLLIPLLELERRRGEIPVGRPLVVVCHSGSRSALATQQLLKGGLERVANLRGGISRWGDEGYPLQSAAGERG